MDASAQRPINGCDFNNEAQIAQVTIEIFSLLCNEDNYTSEELVIAVHALLRQRICECWGDPDTEIMNWDRLEFLGWQIQSRKDTVDSNVNYSVLTSTLSAYYRSDFCKPGSIKRCN